MLKFSGVSIPFSKLDLMSCGSLYKSNPEYRRITSSNALLARYLRKAELGLADIHDHKKLSTDPSFNNSILSKSRGQKAYI